MANFRYWSPLVVVVVGDDEVLVGVLEGWIFDTIRDSVRVNNGSSDVFENGMIFLYLVNLYFNQGQGRGVRGWGWR